MNYSAWSVVKENRQAKSREIEGFSIFREITCHVLVPTQAGGDGCDGEEGV